MLAYMQNPQVMSSKLRQARLTSRKIDFEQLEKDIELVKRFARLKLPKGRVAKVLRSGFVIRKPKTPKTEEEKNC